MTLCLVDEVEEDIVDASSNGSTEVQEFSVYPMKSGFEEVALARILGVEELEKVKDECLINVSLGKVGVEIRALDETQEEFVDNLEMWPCEFEHGLVLFGIVRVSCRVDWWGYRTEKVGCKLRGIASDLAAVTRTRKKRDAYHLDNLWV